MKIWENIKFGKLEVSVSADLEWVDFGVARSGHYEEQNVEIIHQGENIIDLMAPPIIDQLIEIAMARALRDRDLNENEMGA